MEIQYLLNFFDFLLEIATRQLLFFDIFFYELQFKVFGINKLLVFKK